MAVFELYSKRQKRLQGDIPDIYIYDELPKSLRTQVVHIWHDVIGNEINYRSDNYVGRAYLSLVKVLRREYGKFQLCGQHPDLQPAINELIEFFLYFSNNHQQLDIIELSFKLINSKDRNSTRNNTLGAADRAIEELNTRFKEHGVGYQFVENKIVRIDSELIHTEAVKPTLRLLSEPYYQGAQEEFISAYEHYRYGKNKEALTDCLKAFESTMQAICVKQGWTFPSNATASKLIKICFDNELIEPFWQSQMSSLQSLLSSSIPTVRNKLGGHGQGTTPVEVPDHIVAYALHMTASTLLFMITAEEKLT